MTAISIAHFAGVFVNYELRYYLTFKSFAAWRHIIEIRRLSETGEVQGRFSFYERRRIGEVVTSAT